jgi:hypothetical protein
MSCLAFTYINKVLANEPNYGHCRRVSIKTLVLLTEANEQLDKELGISS